MAFELKTLDCLDQLDFDEIIDVRSPSEFAEDHVPGAVNLPVLSDEERAKVGTIYVQESRFKARKVGAALVARNAAKHLDEYLSEKGPGYRPLVYCWRGGQRSGSFATILVQIGWRAEVLSGGYRTYRHLVQTALYDTPFPSQMVVLDGNTGTAKTALLARLAAQGMQVIDLEGLANHRGSLFGARVGGQPSQKAFETALAKTIARIDPEKPVFVEAESARVGDRVVPPSLWQAMVKAPRIEIVAPLKARARYLTHAYRDVTVSPEVFAVMIDQLRAYHAAEVIEEWHELFSTGQYEALAERLMAQHYDPRYAKSRAEKPRPLVRINADSLDPEALNGIAERIAQEMLGITQQGLMTGHL